MLKPFKETIIGLAALVTGLVFILIVILQGDFADVLRKAVLICFECI
jgi:hypothetical protein